MSTQTYAFHEQACFLIDTDVAAAINLALLGGTDVSDEARAAIASEGPYAAVTKHKDLFGPGELEDLRDVQTAMEQLEPHKIECGFASGFEGSARTIEELRSGTVDREWRFDDDFMAVIPPLRAMNFFEAAYPGVTALVHEFKDRLCPILGENFPYAEYVVDVIGTYYC